MFPAYSDTFHIAYSNIVSIFVKPMIVYIIIFIANLFKTGWIENIKDSIFHIIMITFGLGIFIFTGVGIKLGKILIKDSNISNISQERKFNVI